MTVAPAPATASTAAAAPIRCQGRCLPMVVCRWSPRCWRAAAQARAMAAKPGALEHRGGRLRRAEQDGQRDDDRGRGGGQQHGGRCGGRARARPPR